MRQRQELKTVECSNCSGKGKITVLDKSFKPVIVTCSICKGEGVRTVVVNKDATR